MSRATALLIISLIVGGCGGTTAPTPSTTAAPSGSDGVIAGTFDVGGRKLFLQCRGTGTPTLILETGDGDPRQLMEPLADRLEDDHRVCLYDRANKGLSDPAKQPRPAREIADDLATLIDVAGIPGPYVIVGTSLGGLAAWMFSSLYPEDVAGFVSINPPPNPEDWLPAIKPLVTEQEYADEVAAGDGSIDAERSDQRGWIDIATPPDDMPYYILDSTTEQCEGDQLCLKVYDVIEAQTAEMAGRAAGGTWLQIPGGHQLQLTDTDAVIEVIDKVVAAGAS